MCYRCSGGVLASLYVFWRCTDGVLAGQAWILCYICILTDYIDKVAPLWMEWSDTYKQITHTYSIGNDIYNIESTA
jgi:hypothetical protein